MKYIKIRPEGLNAVIDKIENIHHYLENSEPGDKLEIEIVEMSEEDYSNLPEFNGF